MPGVSLLLRDVAFGALGTPIVALSAVTELSVPRVVGLMMGGWFLGTSYSEVLAAQLGKVNGGYLPYWTFDAFTSSSWTAERGWHYYETETYRDSNGQTRSRHGSRHR